MKELQKFVDVRDKSLHAEKELFEFSVRSENIQLKQVCGKCRVFYSRDKSLNDVLRDKKMVNKYRDEQVYVCRYKLVKKTVYTLTPVEWSCEEEEYQNRSGEYSTEEEDDDAANQPINLSDKINELYTSINESHEETDAMAAAADTDLRVTPIKITASAKVVKVKRDQNSATPSSRKTKKTDDADKDEDGKPISPSKRSRLEDETNHNYLTESPRTGRRRPRENIDHCKKNLLDRSFNSTAEGFDDMASPTGSPANFDSYTSKILESKNNSSVKMVLSKRMPLKEHHDNVSSPHTNLRKKVLEETISLTSRSRSSLRPNDGSAKSKWF